MICCAQCLLINTVSEELDVCNHMRYCFLHLYYMFITAALTYSFFGTYLDKKIIF